MGSIIKAGVVGFGNVGRGVLGVLGNTPDMALNVVFTRRPEVVAREIKQMGLFIPVHSMDDVGKFLLDVVILCGGSKEDLLVQGPEASLWYSSVDSFDTHGLIPKHLGMMDRSAKEGGNVAISAIGWDPGLFSLIKAWGRAFFNLRVYPFYGLGERGGLSMGHSNAVRDNVKGVSDARSYTRAISEALARVRAGENPDLKPGEMHWRENFVVVEDGANQEEITSKIQTMPDYFVGYRTKETYISQEEMDQNHQEMFHDGIAIAVGETPSGNKVTMEFKLQLGNNSGTTAEILVAYARAAVEMKKQGLTGAFTILDVPSMYLSHLAREEAIKTFM